MTGTDPCYWRHGGTVRCQVRQLQIQARASEWAAAAGAGPQARAAEQVMARRRSRL